MELELTEEQKQKFKKLRRLLLARVAIISSKFILFLFLSNALVVIIDTLYIHNKAFVVLGSTLNFILNFRSYRIANKIEYDRLKVEVKKILEE